MSGTGHDVVVTSPDHKWMGSSLQRQQPPLLAVLVGKNIKHAEAPKGESGQEIYRRIQRQSIEEDVVVLLLEQQGGKWRDVSVKKLGTGPYKVSEALTINFGNAVRPCETEDEQRDFLKTIGLAVDNQFIGV